ncbi:DUF6148 family protein [Fusobacterium mortiferum]|uniref:DUF6148 family protein n=1 Tax=Fusobacterium mortiferum TaxID=850 RepID=UPI00356655C6
MIFTEEQCRRHLDMWLAAEEALAKGQSYTIGNRTITRVNASEVSKNIETWADRLERVKGSGSPRFVKFIPKG